MKEKDCLLPLDDVAIKLMSNHQVQLKFQTDNGTKIKYISFNEFAEAILASKDSAVSLVTTHETPTFPVTKDVSVLKHKELSNGAEIFMLLRQDLPFDIQYFETLFKGVGIPKLVFAIKVFKNVIQSVKIFAVKDYIVTDESKLYSFPFSNVNGSSGAVCFGGNRLATFNVKDATMLHSFPNSFLSMPSNNDAYGSNLSGLEHRPLLEAMEGKPFNNDWLKDANKTFIKFFNEAS